MGFKDRRIISTMTAEAKEKQSRMEVEGRDPLTGKPHCLENSCQCAALHGQKSSGSEPAGKRKGGEA
jgi:hypothetical protein